MENVRFAHVFHANTKKCVQRSCVSVRLNDEVDEDQARFQKKEAKAA